MIIIIKICNNSVFSEGGGSEGADNFRAISAPSAEKFLYPPLDRGISVKQSVRKNTNQLIFFQKQNQFIWSVRTPVRSK